MMFLPAPFGWEFWTSGDIIPAHDIDEHMIGPDCWCCPHDDGQCVIHNALDRRDEYERVRGGRFH